MASEIALNDTSDTHVRIWQVLTAALGTAALFGSFSAAALLSRRRRCVSSCFSLLVTAWSRVIV